jgi:hypothetical protein
MKIAIWILSCLVFFASFAYAKDVHVRGYYRQDGTYVRPHVRSSPNQYKWDNYGPSRTDTELMNPRLRDNDRDGTPNYLDRDDDNDGTPDDSDVNQYGNPSRW